ncbi:MAG: translation initiation factor IF-2 subunit beta [Candidatus Aenigmatarchaeota archaeon]
MTYEELLERGLKKVPKKAEAGERFVMPTAKVQPAGARTIIVNFFEVASALRRDPPHLLKFLLKELATKGTLEPNRLVVLGRFPEVLINKKIELYVKTYVTCPECGKPDTKLVKEDKHLFMVCEACGAKHPVS